MARFLFVYRGGEDHKLTPDQMQENMQKWGNWIREALKQGWMVDPGDALTPEGRVVNAKKVVTDGPFVESKEQLSGYYILECDHLDDALSWVARIPGARHGAVEVRPLLPGP